MKSRYAHASKGSTPEDQVKLISAFGYNPNPAYPGSVSQRIATIRQAGGGSQAAQPSAGPSDDDLLKRMDRIAPPGGAQPATGGGATGGASTTPQDVGPSDDDLLRRMNAVAPPPAGKAVETEPEKVPPTSDSPLGDQGGMGGSSMPSTSTLSLPTRQDVVNALQPAPGTTYGTVLPFAKDEKTGDLRLALPNALRDPLLGLMQTPSEATTWNPATGTYGLSPEAAAVVPFAAGGLRFGGREPVPPGLAAREAPLSPEFKANALTPEARTAAVTEPAAPVSQTGVSVTPPQAPPSAAPGTAQPAGAQITTEPLPPKTQTERVRDLEKAVNQTAEDRAGPQMRDDTAYVPGIPPRRLAGRDFSDPVNALDEKMAIGSDKAFRKEITAQDRDRNQGMVDLLRTDAQDAPALDRAHDARSQVSPAAMGVFEGEQPTNAASLVAKIDKLLSGPEGKQKAVRSTLKDVRDSLFDSDGNLETMPSRLYGARKNLTDLLKKGVRGTGDVADDVRASKHFLEDLLPDFDETITKGAGRFTEYLKAWSELSKPIDQLEFLQQYQTGAKKLTNDTGYLQPNKVQKMLDDIHQANKAKGVNKGKSLTDEQIANIEAVRNELAAQQLQDRMALVKGSDTFQQLNRAGETGAGSVGSLIKDTLIHTALLPTAGVGNFLYEKGAKPWVAARRAKKTAEAVAARKAELLAPPNPLIQP